MKRLIFIFAAAAVVAGSATIQSVSFAVEGDLSMDQALVAAVEKDHRPMIWELKIDDVREDYEDALEESEDALKRNYANEDYLSAKSISNKRDIYLVPLTNWFTLTGYESSALVQEAETEGNAADAWMDLYVAQETFAQESEEYRLAQMELEALQVRAKAGAVITSTVNTQALTVLQQELVVQEAEQNMAMTAKKLAYWTGLEVDADTELGTPNLRRTLFSIPDEDAYIQGNLLVSDAVWQSLYNYENTVLNIQAIEDGFRGPKFEENQPDAYQGYVIDQMEGAFSLEEALVTGEQALLGELNNLENKSLTAVNQQTNRVNREREWAAAEIRYAAGAISTVEYDTARLNLKKAELAQTEAVFAWNQAVADFKAQQVVYTNRWESMDQTWMDDMKQQVAAWNYDPDAVEADTDEAFVDWILIKNGISPKILDEDE